MMYASARTIPAITPTTETMIFAYLFIVYIFIVYIFPAIEVATLIPYFWYRKSAAAPVRAETANNII